MNEMGHSHSGTWSRQAVGAMPAGLLVVDDAGRLRFANPGAARILRRTPDELRAANLSDLLAPLETLRRRENDETRGQLTIWPEPETPITVGFSLSELQSERGDRHHVVLFQDITQVIQLSEERDRLLQVAALGGVLPTLLHELRNPVAAITASLEVLVEDVSDVSVRQRLDRVLVEIRRVQLGLQGIGSVGRELTSSERSAIDQAVIETCLMMEPVARDVGVELCCSTQPMPLLPIDPSVVRGLLFNLLSNALAATRGTGRVDVTAGLLVSGNLFLSVADTGRGMSRAELGRCTELFYTTKPRGSGIGLALCRSIVEAAGGQILIESELGRGTQVTLVIPTTRPDPSELDHGTTTPSPIRRP